QASIFVFAISLVCNMIIKEAFHIISLTLARNYELEKLKKSVKPDASLKEPEIMAPKTESSTSKPAYTTQKSSSKHENAQKALDHDPIPPSHIVITSDSEEPNCETIATNDQQREPTISRSDMVVDLQKPGEVKSAEEPRINQEDFEVATYKQDVDLKIEDNQPNSQLALKPSKTQLTAKSHQTLTTLTVIKSQVISIAGEIASKHNTNLLKDGRYQQASRLRYNGLLIGALVGRGKTRDKRSPEALVPSPKVSLLF
ncbi:hypothetical protein HDV05_000460, partial [Chytridiales sp. JEL 0842]